MSALATRGDGAAPDVVLLQNDLDERAYAHALREPALGWDVETTGLDWRSGRLATVQLQAGEVAYVVRIGKREPARLKALLEQPAITKVMHHAIFDLRFMVHAWDARPRAVACTKISSKLAAPDAPAAEHSLDSLVWRFFGVRLDKRQQTSDWAAPALRRAQVAYAAADVRHLLLLHRRLERILLEQSRLELRDGCYAHLPTRVALELGGFPDVYAY